MRRLIISLAALAVACMLRQDVAAGEEGATPAQSSVDAIEKRIVDIEAELTKLTGLTPVLPSPAPADRVGALSVRMTGVDAILKTLAGIIHTPQAGAVDRLRALEVHVSGVEAILKALSGFEPSRPAESSGSSGADPGDAVPPGGLAHRLELAREHLAYCRWREARAEASAWRKERAKAGLSVDEAVALEDETRESERAARLGYLYLTSLARSETETEFVWEVRFVSRPTVVASFRLNFYATSEKRVVRVTSRFYQDLMRGEHVLLFHWPKGQTLIEGNPLAARVELCYAGHAVDLLSEGKSPAAEWWKRSPVGSTGFINQDHHIATDGMLVNQVNYTNFWIVDTVVEPWTLDSVRQTYRRIDDRMVEGDPESGDVLPDEAALVALPKPHAGYRLVAGGERPSNSKLSGATPAPPASEAAIAEIASRVRALDVEAVYGPDAATLAKLAKLATDATRIGVDTTAVQGLRERVLKTISTNARSAFRIKRIDVQKPTADNGQRWIGVVTFQVTRKVTDPFRINFYTLLPDGRLCGSYVMCDGVVWDGPGQEFAYTLVLDVGDVGSKAMKWRAEIGWQGVCCAQAETTGPPGKGWWYGVVERAHQSFAQRRPDAPGVFRVASWGQIAEASLADRFLARKSDK